MNNYAALSNGQRNAFARACCRQTGCAEPRGKSARSLSLGRLFRQRSVYLVARQFVEKAGQMLTLVSARGKERGYVSDGVQALRLR